MSIVRLCKYTTDGIAKLGTVIWLPNSPFALQPQIREFDPLLPYSKNTIVFYNGELYFALRDLNANVWDIEDWDYLPVLHGFVAPHNPLVTYKQDDFILYEDRIYRSLDTAVPITGPWDSAQWELVSANTAVEAITCYSLSSTGLPSDFKDYAGTIRKVVLADGTYPNEAADPIDPVDPPGPAMSTYIGYYPSWRTELTALMDSASTGRRPSNVPTGFSHVKIAFAHTKPVFDTVTPDLTTTGLQFPVNTESQVKADIATLHATGTKVYLSVGGATYGRPTVADAWTDLITEADAITADIAQWPVNTPYAKALYDIIAYLDIDGLDLDFEDDPAHYTDRLEWLDAQYKLLRLFRFIGDAVGVALQRTVSIATACWSTGWDATADTNADAATPNYPGDLVSYFGGAAGRDRSLYGGYTSTALGGIMNATDFVDVFVNMSYDAIFSDFAGTGNPAGPYESKYDPVVAYQQCRSIVTDPAKICTIGIAPASEGFGDHNIMLMDTDCATTGPHPTFLDLDQYQRSVNAPYSVERSVGAVLDNLDTFANDGVILWSIYAPDAASPYSYNGKDAATWATATTYIATMQ